MQTSFENLGVSQTLIDALQAENIIQPTEIQSKAIPEILAGKDILAQAQTGSGKTAAFAIPVLQQLDVKQPKPQVLVLTPTRELAQQVSETFRKIGKGNRKLEVCAIYGGEGYKNQISQLKRGAQIVVGTPGRLIDHIEKSRLDLTEIKQVVIDEADEMLKMGFIDDVKWMLEKTPEAKQTALFSATMPSIIKKISREFLKDPIHVHIPNTRESAPDITQHYVVAPMAHRLPAILRLLELRKGQGVLIFTRTRSQTVEVHQYLQQHGYLSSAINGDLKQADRERALKDLDKAKIDIVVATDVAARGIDIARVECVINFEAPFDQESYVHRIGRTGRAGRKGESIVLISRRELRLIQGFEKITKSTIKQLMIPNAKQINSFRKQQFIEQVLKRAETHNLEAYQSIIDDLKQQLDIEIIAKAIAAMQHKQPFFIDEKNDPLLKAIDKGSNNRRNSRSDNGSSFGDRNSKNGKSFKKGKMTKYKIAVGRKQGIKPHSVIKALAGNSTIDAQSIGQIDIQSNHSTVYLPKEISAKALSTLKRAKIHGIKLAIAPC
jgi:ATP-dependent RNA helicase DeaD